MENTGNLEYWVKRISEEFYELVYEDEWLKDVFKSVEKEHITNQQVDFMVGAMGGEKRFSGRNPSDAHPHIFVTEEMWNHREALLDEAMLKVGCPEDIAARWKRIDHAFKKQIVMSNPAECKKRFFTDEIINVPKPFKRSA